MPKIDWSDASRCPGLLPSSTTLEAFSRCRPLHPLQASVDSTPLDAVATYRTNASHHRAATAGPPLLMAVHLQFLRGAAGGDAGPVLGHLLVVSANLADDLVERLLNVLAGLGGGLDELAAELSSELGTLCFGDVSMEARTSEV